MNERDNTLTMVIKLWGNYPHPCVLVWGVTILALELLDNSALVRNAEVGE